MVSEDRKVPETAPLWSGVGSGRGREKRREDCSSRAVGELTAFDMVVYTANGIERVLS